MYIDFDLGRPVQRRQPSGGLGQGSRTALSASSEQPRTTPGADPIRKSSAPDSFTAREERQARAYRAYLERHDPPSAGSAVVQPAGAAESRPCPGPAERPAGGARPHLFLVGGGVSSAPGSLTRGDLGALAAGAPALSSLGAGNPWAIVDVPRPHRHPGDLDSSGTTGMSGRTRGSRRGRGISIEAVATWTVITLLYLVLGAWVMSTVVRLAMRHAGGGQ